MDQQRLYKRLRTLRNNIDDLMTDLQRDIIKEDIYLETPPQRDFDIIAVGRSKSQQDRIKSVLDIIRELGREKGEAPYDVILERSYKLGFEKDLVDLEIVRLLQSGAIVEPKRYSGFYKVST